MKMITRLNSEAMSMTRRNEGDGWKPSQNRSASGLLFKEFRPPYETDLIYMSGSMFQHLEHLSYCFFSCFGTSKRYAAGRRPWRLDIYFG